MKIIIMKQTINLFALNERLIELQEKYKNPIPKGSYLILQ